MKSTETIKFNAKVTGIFIGYLDGPGGLVCRVEYEADHPTSFFPNRYNFQAHPKAFVKLVEGLLKIAMADSYKGCLNDLIGESIRVEYVGKSMFESKFHRIGHITKNIWIDQDKIKEG